MRRPIAFFLALAMLLALTACAGGVQTPNGAGTTNGQNKTSAEDVLALDIGGEITVSCYETMLYKPFLEEAAKKFEEKYPGTKVNIEAFSAMPEIKTSEQDGKTISVVQMQEDPQARTDYINKVSTSLMGGTGADVLAMDVLPIHKYAASGQLEDLNAYMSADPDFNRPDYRENILSAIQYKGGAWFLPLDYSFNYYAYDSTLLTGGAAARFGTDSAFAAEQLIDAASGGYSQGGPNMFNMPDYAARVEAGMFGQLLKEKYSSLVDVQNKKANFDDGSFAALLESVRQYSDKGYVPKGVTGQKDAGAMISDSMQLPTDRYYFKEKNNFSLMQHYNKNSGLRMMISYGGALSAIEDDDEIAGIQANADGSVPFTFTQAYGINSASKNKQTAWAFVKFLLSEEMQLSTSLSPMGLPLSNAAREKKGEQLLSGAFMGGKTQGQGPAGAHELSDAQKEVLLKYAEAVERLSDQIDSYVFEDQVVNDMIASEVKYYFEGSKSAEEVAGVLQNKANLYLNE